MAVRKKIWRIVKKTLLVLTVLLIILAFAFLTTTDYTHYHKQDYYKSTIAKADSLQFNKPIKGAKIRAGWSKVNITPDKPCNLAGYGNRGEFKNVSDSIYTNAIVLNNSQSQVAIVSIDLLFIDPIVEEAITNRADSLGINLDGIYFCATHTHNSIGDWNKSYGGSFILGEYKQEIVDHIAEKTCSAISLAQQQLDTVQFAFASVNEGGFVHNRIADYLSVDSTFRVMLMKKSNGDKAMFCAYSAHPTYLTEHNTSVGNDYVGFMNRQLEKNLDLELCVFSAGTVGSHSPIRWLKKGNTVQNFGEYIANKVTADLNIPEFEYLYDLGFTNLPLDLGEPQLRSQYTFNLRIRPWVFNSFFGKPESELKFLRIGENFLVGTPCDFSGEFSQKLMNKTGLDNHNLIVTSFNGSYIGYAVPLNHYQIPHAETHEMNWFGPYTGEYITELIGRSISQLN